MSDWYQSISGAFNDYVVAPAEWAWDALTGQKPDTARAPARGATPRPQQGRPSAQVQQRPQPDPRIRQMEVDLKTLGLLGPSARADGLMDNATRNALARFRDLTKDDDANFSNVRQAAIQAQRDVQLFQGIRADVNQNLTPAIAFAIRNGAEQANMPVATMFKKAEQESTFRPAVTAGTSTASGLYQFTEDTWLQAIDRWGAKYGLDRYADNITTRNWQARASSPEMRREILALRSDPHVSALMAAELSRDNFGVAQSVTRGVQATPETLYALHVLGASVEGKAFIRALHNSPGTSASDVAPKAAGANRSIFYASGGRERSVQEVFALWENNFGENQYQQRLERAGASSDRQSAPAVRRPR